MDDIEFEEALYLTSILPTHPFRHTLSTVPVPRTVPLRPPLR